MAATYTKTTTLSIPGSGGFRMETGLIEFDSDKTIEVRTGLHFVDFFIGFEVGSGATTSWLTLDEVAALNGNRIVVPTTGALTVDYPSTSTKKFQYIILGQ